MVDLLWCLEAMTKNTTEIRNYPLSKFPFFFCDLNNSPLTKPGNFNILLQNYLSLPRYKASVVNCDSKLLYISFYSSKNKLALFRCDLKNKKGFVKVELSEVSVVQSENKQNIEGEKLFDSDLIFQEMVKAPYSVKEHQADPAMCKMIRGLLNSCFEEIHYVKNGKVSIANLEGISKEALEYVLLSCHSLLFTRSVEKSDVVPTKTVKATPAEISKDTTKTESTEISPKHTGISSNATLDKSSSFSDFCNIFLYCLGLFRKPHLKVDEITSVENLDKKSLDEKGNSF